MFDVKRCDGDVGKVWPRPMFFSMPPCGSLVCCVIPLFFFFFCFDLNKHEGYEKSRERACNAERFFPAAKDFADSLLVDFSCFCLCSIRRLFDETGGRDKK